MTGISTTQFRTVALSRYGRGVHVEPANLLERLLYLRAEVCPAAILREERVLSKARVDDVIVGRRIIAKLPLSILLCAVHQRLPMEFLASDRDLRGVRVRNRTSLIIAYDHRREHITQARAGQEPSIYRRTIPFMVADLTSPRMCATSVGRIVTVPSGLIPLPAALATSARFLRLSCTLAQDLSRISAISCRVRFWAPGPASSGMCPSLIQSCGAAEIISPITNRRNAGEPRIGLGH